VVAQQFYGLVTVAVIDDRAVVAGEDDQGIFGKSQPVKGFQDLAHRPVKLGDGIPAGSHSGHAPETGVGNPGHVDVMGSEEKEEGFPGGGGLVGFEEADGFGGDGVGDVFVDPEGGGPPAHVADTADAVYDGHIVAMAGVHCQQVGVGTAQGQPLKGVGIADFYRIGGVEVGDLLVFDEYAGGAVAGGRHDIGVIKPDFPWAGGDQAVPVLGVEFSFTEAQVPFADHGGGITCITHQAGHRILILSDDHGSVAAGYAGIVTSPGVFAGEHPIAGGCAGGCTGVGVGEAYSLFSQPVDVGGPDSLCPITFQVAIADVVGVDDHHVGFLPGKGNLRWCAGRRGGQKGDRQNRIFVPGFDGADSWMVHGERLFRCVEGNLCERKNLPWDQGVTGPAYCRSEGVIL